MYSHLLICTKQILCEKRIAERMVVGCLPACPPARSRLRCLPFPACCLSPVVVRDRASWEGWMDGGIIDESLGKPPPPCVRPVPPFPSLQTSESGRIRKRGKAGRGRYWNSRFPASAMTYMDTPIASAMVGCEKFISVREIHIRETGNCFTWDSTEEKSD